MELVFRHVFFGLLVLVLLAGLLNVFGQRPTNTHAATSVADLQVFGPEALRGGLYYEGRITVEAKQEIEKTTLVFDSGWTEQMQINTIEPSPVGESSRDGRLTLDMGRLAAGRKLVSGSSSRSTRRTSAAARRTWRSTTTRRSSLPPTAP